MRYLFRVIGLLGLLGLFLVPILGMLSTITVLIGATEDIQWGPLERFGIIGLGALAQIITSAYFCHAVGLT